MINKSLFYTNHVKLRFFIPKNTKVIDDFIDFTENINLYGKKNGDCFKMDKGILLTDPSRTCPTHGKQLLQ